MRSGCCGLLLRNSTLTCLLAHGSWFQLDRHEPELGRRHHALKLQVKRFQSSRNNVSVSYMCAVLTLSPCSQTNSQAVCTISFEVACPLQREGLSQHLPFKEATEVVE